MFWKWKWKWKIHGEGIYLWYFTMTMPGCGNIVVVVVVVVVVFLENKDCWDWEMRRNDGKRYSRKENSNGIKGNEKWKTLWSALVVEIAWRYLNWLILTDCLVDEGRKMMKRRRFDHRSIIMLLLWPISSGLLFLVLKRAGSRESRRMLISFSRSVP